ncbi:hypothetical protein UFOVP75_85 [uncultured Caudovirales phage]|uniref:Uncharacterized protein n=1 Tax=uncultured Caudovirales phage TaxID=2100421 RepID=A0A6J5KYT7_9CAUD|nr:hypothetical protein UFOVP75_85 [uncultured Caudovirales phage]
MDHRIVPTEVVTHGSYCPGSRRVLSSDRAGVDAEGKPAVIKGGTVVEIIGSHTEKCGKQKAWTILEAVTIKHKDVVAVVEDPMNPFKRGFI